MSEPFRIEVTTAPTIDIVSRASVKEFLRIFHTEHDAELDEVIQAVAELMEGELDLHLRRQTVDVYLARFTTPFTRIPIAPLSSVTGIYRQVDSETYEEWTSTSYEIRGDGLVSTSRYPFFRPKSEHSYPSVSNTTPFPIKVTCVVGYETEGDIPEKYKLQAKHAIAHHFENRGFVSDRTKTPVPMTADSLRAQNAIQTFD